MKKRDILSLIRLDVQRKNKPKKKLDDFLLGEEDQHEEIMHAKRKKDDSVKKKSNVMEEEIGASKQDEAAVKPNIRQLDWGTLSRMSLREQNIELKREYISLLEKLEEVAANVASEKGGNSEKAIKIEKYKKDMKLLRDFLREIVGLIPDGYELRMQMDTTSWSVAEVEDEIMNKIKSLVSKLKFTDKIIEEETKKVAAQKQFLENELIRARERIKDLEGMILNGSNSESSVQGTTLEKQPESQESYNNNQQVPPAVVQDKQEDNVDNKITNKEAPQQQVIQKRNPFEQTKSSNSSNSGMSSGQGSVKIPEIPEEVPKYLFIETDRYLENFPDECKFTLEVIGRTGVSRNAELKNEMEQLEEGKKYFFPNNHYEYGYLNNAVKTLKDRQFITSKEINLGARGYKFLVYELTDIGKAVYYKFTQQQPVEAEMHKMLGDHKSLEHGYLIREVANEFRAKHYTVHEDRESCTYKLEDGKRKVFDLVIEKDGQKQHIEVERGTHNDDDFFKAMDKIYQITSEFYFVAPNEKILYQVTKGKVFKWITDRLGGFENAKGKMKMHFSTIEKIKKSDEPWEVFAL